MKKRDLYYAVTRTHSHELGLLSTQDLLQMIDMPSVEDVFNFLHMRGWGDSSLPAGDSHALLQFETQKTWALLEELTGTMEEFDVFRLGNDYNNLKAAIKLSYTDEPEESYDKYFMPFGTIPKEVIIEAVRSGNFSKLPDAMIIPAKQAFEALAHTGSGQNCDIIIDAASLKAVYVSGKKTGNELLEKYAELNADVGNIKIAIRAHYMGKGKDFLDLAISDAGSLNINRLKQASLGSRAEVCNFLNSTKYREAVPCLEQSLTCFERWCDNHLMKSIRMQRHAIDGIEPLAAYLLARQGEISMARLILSAKINHLEPETVKERMREMYV